MHIVCSLLNKTRLWVESTHIYLYICTHQNIVVYMNITLLGALNPNTKPWNNNKPNDEKLLPLAPPRHDGRVVYT